MKKTALMFAAVLAAFVLPIHAAPVKVGVYVQPPFISLNPDDGKPQGLCVDLLEALAAQKGWTLSYTVDSRATILARLARREVDVMAPAPIPMEGSAQLDYTSEGILSSQGQLFMAGRAMPISLQDMAGKTIAVVRDDVHYARLLETLRNVQIRCQFLEMRRYEDVLDAIKGKRADAGLIDHFFGYSISRQDEITSGFAMGAPVDFRFAVAKDCNRDLLLTLSQGLAGLKADLDSPYYSALSRWARSDSRSILSRASQSSLWLVALLVASILLLLRIRHNARQQSNKLVNANRNLLKTVDDHLNRESAAEQLRDWYRTLLNNTHDAILIHGVDQKGLPGKFVEANETACLKLGYTHEELLSLSPANIEVIPDSGRAPRYAKLLSRWRNARLPDATEKDQAIGSLTQELSFRAKSGVEFPVEITLRVLDHEGQPVIYYSAHDITPRRQAQEALRESERRFADFFLRSPIGVALYDPSRKLTDVNQAALAIFGCSERSQFAATRLLESSDLSPEAHATLLKGGTIRHESVVDFDDVKKHQLYATSRSGKCHFDMLMTNLGLDSNFNPKGYMVQIQDITDHRRAEETLRQHERMLRQAQKMEAIGTLAGGIAHDFNNILTPIIGYTEMSMLMTELGSPIRTNLEEVLKASHHAKELVKQILTFSRQTEHEVKPIRLTPLVNEVMKLLKGSILPNIELQVTLQSERDIVRADPTQMHQVIMNLCTNAMHAMKEKGGILEVGMRPVNVDTRTRGSLARLRYGAYVEIFVRDTGHGMDRSVLDRIFEPFFTTKRSGEGTGMGLAMVHGIVTSLHGTTTVESEVGKGTTFHVVLPLLDQATEQSSGSDEPIPRGTERILYVDDEAGIVNMDNQMLTSLGYRVVTCMRGVEALTLFRNEPARFDLVITDQIMPGMSGMEMIKELHLIRRDIPVLLCTGFSKTVPDQNLRAEGVKEVLMKPIVLRQMAEAIRRALKAKK